jgi:hypothetical protein
MVRPAKKIRATLPVRSYDYYEKAIGTYEPLLVALIGKNCSIYQVILP